MYTVEEVKANEVSEKVAVELVFTTENLGMSWKNFNYHLNFGTIAVIQDGDDLVLVRKVGFMYEEVSVVEVSVEEDKKADTEGINYILDMMEAAIIEPDLQGDYEYWKGEADAWLDYYECFCDVSEAAKRFAQLIKKENNITKGDDEMSMYENGLCMAFDCKCGFSGDCDNCIDLKEYTAFNNMEAIRNELKLENSNDLAKLLTMNGEAASVVIQPDSGGLGESKTIERVVKYLIDPCIERRDGFLATTEYEERRSCCIHHIYFKGDHVFVEDYKTKKIIGSFIANKNDANSNASF